MDAAGEGWVEEIRQRWREHLDIKELPSLYTAQGHIHELLAMLTQAEARLRAVEAERDQGDQAYHEMRGKWCGEMTKREEYEAEARRLRAALVKIEAMQSHCECWDISRTALTP